MLPNSSIRLSLFISLVVIALGILIVVSLPGDSQNEDDFSQNESLVGNFKLFPPPLPDRISFAGEKPPLDLFYVREALDRELLINTYWHSNTILMLKRANRWFPVIEPILRDHKIPDDFKYLALAESAFTRVVSPAGAAGFWQFLEKTARENGLEVNEHVDERYHVEKATRAACKYFLESYTEYENWTLVAAAFNAGKKRITESLAQQKSSTYYELHLNEETSRYIYRIMAIKEICENPEKYGFIVPGEDLYPSIPVKTLEISEPIANLADFASENRVSFKMLKELNPWLRSNSLPNSSARTYRITLPE